MILALTMSHIVGRPATGMGGGTKNPMERPASRRLIFALIFCVKTENSKLPENAKFVGNVSHRETHFAFRNMSHGETHLQQTRRFDNG